MYRFSIELTDASTGESREVNPGNFWHINQMPTHTLILFREDHRMIYVRETQEEIANLIIHGMKKAGIPDPWILFEFSDGGPGVFTTIVCARSITGARSAPGDNLGNDTLINMIPCVPGAWTAVIE